MFHLGIQVFSGCHVPNVLKLATSVCGMLFRLEENLRTLKGSSDISVTLARCASDFNRMVVEKLEKVGFIFFYKVTEQILVERAT